MVNSANNMPISNLNVSHQIMNITHQAANITAGKFNPFTAQQGFFSIIWGGVHLWVWAFCVIAICMLIGVLAYVFREWLNFQFLRLTKPQRLIKIIIHYPGAMFSIFWRIIPLKNKFEIGKEKYYFDPEALTKQQLQNSSPSDHESFKYIINGKSYKYEGNFRIKYRWAQFPEIHYIYGNPNPISWQFKAGAANLTAFEDAQLEDSDLFQQFLASEQLEKMMPIILILLIIIIVLAIAIGAKVFNLIH